MQRQVVREPPVRGADAFEAVLALAYVGLCIYSAYLGWKNEQMERDFLDMLREDSEREDA